MFYVKVSLIVTFYADSLVHKTSYLRKYLHVQKQNTRRQFASEEKRIIDDNSVVENCGFEGFSKFKYFGVIVNSR